MRVEITQGRGASARVTKPDWTAAITRSSGYLSVWYRGQHVTLSGDAAELVETWQRIRDGLGEGPLATEVRDAFAVCRAALGSEVRRCG